MHNWLGRTFTLVVVGLVVGGLAFAFWPQPVGVDVSQAIKQPLLVTVDEDGKTRIREKYVVSAPLSGRLLRIEMDPGDSVVAGETLLAVLQPRDPELLDARSIAQAEARVEAAEAALDRTTPLLEQAKLEESYAEIELGRIVQAAERGGATKSEADTAEMRYRHAGEAVRSAIQAQVIAKFELEQSRAALIRSKPADDQPAENGREFSIRSPITGRILRVFQESAAVVTAGTPLLELGAPSDLEIEVDVLSSDAVKIEPGDRVLLEQWGGDRALEGEVRLVEPAGFMKISTLGVEEQRVNVIIDLVDPPEQRRALGDGFRVEARIVVDESQAALCVPTSSLFRTGEEWALFKVVDNVARLTRVEVGLRNGLQAEILQGVVQGDAIIVHPSDRIDDGVQVEAR